MTNEKASRQFNRVPVDRCHLYRIKSPHALAKRIGWKLDKLEELAKDGDYRVFQLKSGRTVQEPSPQLQSLHRQIHRYLAKIEVPNYLHSAIKGRSYLSNARAHVGCERLIKIDVRKFFPSVPQHKVMVFFRDTMGCGPDVAGLLANLICLNGKLATGSAVSPIISYYAFQTMFDKIDQIAAENDLVMTCYVDDITISGENASRAILHQIRLEMERAGLKTHKSKFYSGKRAKPVTGVMVTANGMKLPFDRWKKIRKQIKIINGLDADADKPAAYSSLVSRLYEAAQIEPSLKNLADYYHRKWRAII